MFAAFNCNVRQRLANNQPHYLSSYEHTICIVLHKEGDLTALCIFHPDKPNCHPFKKPETEEYVKASEHVNWEKNGHTYAFIFDIHNKGVLSFPNKHELP